MSCTFIWATLLISAVQFTTPTEKIRNYKLPSLDDDFSGCDGANVERSTEVHCMGKTLLEIPSNLQKSMTKLSVTDSYITHIKRAYLDPYRENLRDVTLSNLPYLRVIEDGTFANASNLRTLYISYAPQLKFLHGILMGVTSSTFYSLRIVWTGLVEIPDLYHLPANNTMFLLDLDHNKIERLPANSIKISAQQVTINFNRITAVEDWAFNGSQIAELYMHSNSQLSYLGEKAFKGVSSLRILDLSHTAIENMPEEGLQELEVLKIEKTPTMKTIPSIYDLKNLREAKLTHSFHCCAFQYPAQHNPEKHAKYEENIKNLCRQLEKSKDEFKRRKKRLTDSQVLPLYSRFVPLNNIRGGGGFTNLTNDSAQLLSLGTINKIVPLRGKTIGHQDGKITDPDDSDDGFFHPRPMKINDSQLDAYCGKLIVRIPEVECSPKPDALNPCEDIMGASWLRISVWCVVVLALIGNLAVILVVVFSDSEITVTRFLICNLAFADFCMGLYLLLIASMDYHSVGAYFNFAFNWQYGVGCQIAGFLTVFSSTLSIYTLTIVTLERWFAITYAINLTKRITIKSAVYILIAGWFHSIIIAALPVFGVSNYSSTSICLPMDSNEILDKIYLYTLILVNGFAFILIVVCYVQIYLSLGYETRRTCTKGELTIAKKMALLIFVDFATVAPIAFFGLTALAGYPLIGVPRSKILLVFFYPLNACANPYLYALMTSQYRRDLVLLTSRCGICKKKADRYRFTDGLPPSKSTQLLNNPHRYTNGQCTTKRSSDSRSNKSYV